MVYLFHPTEEHIKYCLNIGSFLDCMFVTRGALPLAYEIMKLDIPENIRIKLEKYIESWEDDKKHYGYMDKPKEDINILIDRMETSEISEIDKMETLNDDIIKKIRNLNIEYNGSVFNEIRSKKKDCLVIISRENLDKGNNNDTRIKIK